MAACGADSASSGAGSSTGGGTHAASSGSSAGGAAAVGGGGTNAIGGGGAGGVGGHGGSSATTANTGGGGATSVGAGGGTTTTATSTTSGGTGGAAGAGGMGGATTGTTASAGGGGCSSAADCDDGNPDTVDVCTAGVCSHVNQPAGTYVDAAHGSDTSGDGTVGMPFQHLHKAATVATSGQTIWAFPGVYGFDTAFVQLADGVGLQALTSGTVSVTTPVTFAGSGFARGILFDQAQVNVSSGTVNLDAVQFNRAVSGSGASGINLTSTGKVVLTPGGVTNYLGDSATVNFARLRDSSRLEIQGGTFRDTGSSFFSRDWLLDVENSASLLLDGVTMDRCRVNGIELYDNAQVTLQNHTLLRDCAQNQSSSVDTSIYVSASGASPSPTPTVVLDNSTITWASPFPTPVASAVGIFVEQTTVFPNITVRNGSVIELNQSHGIMLNSTGGTLTLDSSRISDNGGDGVLMRVSSSQSLTTSGAVITRNVGSGVELSGVFQVMMRNTQVTSNGLAGVNGVNVDATSTINLGKSGDNGGNTFTGNAPGSTSYANVQFSATGNATDYAAGNTWDASKQGTDGAGHFIASGLTLTATPGSPFGTGLTAANVTLIEYGSGTSLNLIVGP